MKSSPKKGAIPKCSIPRRHVSELIHAWCRTRTLKSFEHAAEISHSFAIYLRDKGSLECGRAGDVVESLRRNGEPRMADDFTLAYLRDHIPSGTESRVDVGLRRPETKTRPVKDAKARAMLEWLAGEIERDPAVHDMVSAMHALAHR